MKLKGKLVLSFGSVVTATLIVFGIIIYYTFAQSTIEDAIKIVKLQNSELQGKTEKIIRLKLERTHQQITPYIDVLTSSQKPSTFVNSLFQTIVEDEPLFDSLTYHNLKNNSCFPEVPQLSPTIKSLLKSQKYYYSKEPFFLHSDGATYLVWPFNNGNNMAQLVFMVNEEAYNILLKSLLPITEAIVIVSVGDLVLFDTLVTNGPSAQNSFRLIDFNTPEKITNEVVFSNGYYAYKLSHSLFKADLTLALPQAYFLRNLVFLKNRIITALVIICWVSIWVILIVTNTITNPITKLSRATKDIESFDYSAELKTSSKDEIGELVTNFGNMRQAIKNMVTKDPLTHVYNRRFLMHIFELALLKAIRLEKPLSCIMMDIDYFKKINDNFGHQIGDEVLIQIGKVLLDLSRSYDTPARYGGEEFILILPETDIQGALTFAERVRKAIENLTIFYSDEKLRCTVSLGVSTLDRYTAKTTADIIKNADSALYQAKESGRNKTVVFDANYNESTSH